MDEPLRIVEESAPSAEQTPPVAMTGRKVKVVIARMLYRMWERGEVGSWLARTMLELSRHPQVEAVGEFPVDMAPVDRARNFACDHAKFAAQADYLFMVDADMHPDRLSKAPVFALTAFNFALQHDGPCVVIAPALTGPPDVRVCVHQPVETANGRIQLDSMPPQAAIPRSGVQAVPAGGVSLSLIDLRALDNQQRPWFEFVYADEKGIDLVSGEDTTFTARLADPENPHRVPVYCAWDCWEGHFKETCYFPDLRAKYGGLAVPQKRVLVPGGLS